ncbi:hypothetical protein L917_21636, partial [Phytophthora nicotianae]
MARIRSTGRQKPAPTPHDVDFRHLWRQLREAKWNSRRPKGLETDWKYMKPGASADGTVGVDIFVGEAAVVAYVIEAGLLVAEDEADGNGHKDEGQSHSEDEGQHEEQDNEDGELTEDLVRASQINTSVELSQRTMDAMFGSPTPSEVALSQGAVARAFDLVQDDVSEPDILNGVSQLQHLSGASGAERVDSD